MCIYAYRRRPKTNVLRRLITIVFKWAARRKSVVETTKTARLIGYVGIEGVGSKSARGDFLLLITKIRSHFRRILSSGRYAAVPGDLAIFSESRWNGSEVKSSFSSVGAFALITSARSRSYKRTFPSREKGEKIISSGE